MAFSPVPYITPYPFWTQFTPTLPSLYWDVDSHEERIKRICLELHKLVEYSNYLGNNINIDHETIKELQDAFQKFMESGFDDYYKEQIEQWITDNFASLMKLLLNQGIFFGLTEDGYFCANVLMQLTIYFDTIMDYSSDDYGKLTLTY